MKVLYLDCGMGIAGDMLMGALYECLPDKQLFWDKVKELQIPGVEIEAVETKKCGITGTHMKVMVHGQEEISEDEHDHHHDHTFEHSHSHEHNHEQDHHHDHDHIHSHDLEHEHHHEQDLSAEHVKTNETLVNTGFDNNAENAHERNNDNFDHQSHHHHHHHAHTSMKNIEDMVSQFSLDDLIKKRVLSVYEKIAEAEAKVHGTAISEIHFHEVGNMDAVADIVCNMILLDLLKVDRIIASPINVGFGKVRCAHGILPVPAPATAEILKGVPVYAGRFEGEMCTPTGAALYQTIVDETAQMPVMSMETFGYGCGTKDFPAANVVRAVIGETAQEKGHIIELACNLDDMTAEDIALASELLMLHGALDVFTTSIQMKKNRPGTLLSVLCREDQKSKLAELIFKHTTTIGIREYSCDRMVLDRKMGEVSTPYGTVHYKEVSGYGVNRSKIEFDDLREAVEKYEKSIRDIRSEIEKLL